MRSLCKETRHVLEVGKVKGVPMMMKLPGLRCLLRRTKRDVSALSYRTSRNRNGPPEGNG